jgi:DNA-directed RNA polymerase specialized sigma24 family protein
MLEELAKLDKEWRLIALKICGNKSLADDLVNDMYIKMHDRQPPKFNRHYISYAIYHLYLNHIKKQAKTLFLEDVDYVETDENNYTTEIRIKVDNILNEIGFFDREILLHTHEKSLRKTAEALAMNYGKLFYQKKIALEKLLDTEGIKTWKDER